MISIFERACAALPRDIVVALVKSSPPASPRTSELLVRAATSCVTDRLCGELESLEFANSLLQIVEECGFDEIAVERLRAMNVASHLAEVISAGRDIGTRLFGGTSSVDLEALATQFELNTEVAADLLDVMLLFVVATIGAETKRSGLSAEALQASRIEFLSPSPHTGSGKVSVGPRARFLGSRSAMPLSDNEDAHFLGADVPQFMRWDPTEEATVTSTRTGFRSVALIAPVLLGGAAYLFFQSDSGNMLREFAFSEDTHLAEEIPVSQVRARKRQRLAQDTLEANTELSTDEARAGLSPQVLPEAAEELEAVTAGDPVTAETGIQVEPVGALESVAAVSLPPSAASQNEAQEVVSPGNVTGNIESEISRLQELLESSDKVTRESGTFVLSGIEFEKGRGEPETDTSRWFTRIAELLADHPRARVEISVPTRFDAASEDDISTLALAQLRAERLKSSLLRLGVSRSRVDGKGVRTSDTDLAGKSGVGNEVQGQVQLVLLRR